MRIAFLILAHNTPNHLRRLVEALRHPDHHAFVHVDKKQDIEPFGVAMVDGVTFIARREVEWGDITGVQAAIDLLRAASGTNPPFDYFMLLSASDYPLYSAADINRFFEEHAGTEFLNIVEMPNDKMGKPISRFERFYPKKGRGFTLLERLRTRYYRTRKRDYRKALGGRRPFGGSAWFAFTREAVDEILRFVRSQRRASAFLANTLIPEEAFFQTIIGNSRLMPRVSRNLTYVDWRDGGPSPVGIDAGHIAGFEKDVFGEEDAGFGPGVLLFARKFADDAEDLVARLAAGFPAKRVPGPATSRHRTPART